MEDPELAGLSVDEMNEKIAQTLIKNNNEKRGEGEGEEIRENTEPFPLSDLAQEKRAIDIETKIESEFYCSFNRRPVKGKECLYCRKGQTKKCGEWNDLLGKEFKFNRR